MESTIHWNLILENNFPEIGDYVIFANKNMNNSVLGMYCGNSTFITLNGNTYHEPEVWAYPPESPL